MWPGNGVDDPHDNCTADDVSPCIDTAGPNNEPSDDIDDGTRPVNVDYDMGSDEYGTP